MLSCLSPGLSIRGKLPWVTSPRGEPHSPGFSNLTRTLNTDFRPSLLGTENVALVLEGPNDCDHLLVNLFMPNLFLSLKLD